MNRLVLFLIILLFPLAAQADYYLWEDEKSGLTITFPDTWKLMTSRHPHEILTITAPSHNEDPTCTVKVEDDRRYVIYPPHYGDAVQREAVSVPFWRSYMGNYDEYRIDRVYDGGGLGRWLASYAFASYTKRDGTAYQQRRGIMFASLYNDKLYTVECSTLNHAYEKWDNNFRSIIKSIDFKKAYHEWPTGEHENFLKGADLYFWSQTGPEGTSGY